MNKIAVLGLGKVCSLAAQLLHDANFDVTGFDKREVNEDLAFPCTARTASAASSETIRLTITGNVTIYATHGWGW